jgi:hypothetical protein
LLIYPWAYIDQTTPDNSLFEKMSAEIIDSINVVDPQIQYQSRLSGSWYWHGGEHNDWMYSQYGMLSMTVELMASQSALPSNHENEVVLPAFRVMLRRPEKSGITGTITDDFTGNPVGATVKIVGLFDEEQLQPRMAEPVFGRFIRFLTPGSYTLEISAPEFQTVIQDITIGQTKTMDTLNFRLTKNLISLSGVQIDDSNDGNNNAVLNRGEKVQLNLSVKNTRRAMVENVYGILRSESPFITFTQDSVFWGTIDSTQTNVAGLSPFELVISNNVIPGAVLKFQINFLDNKGNFWHSDFSKTVQGFFDNVTMNESSNWTHQMIKTQDDWQWGIPNGKVDDPSFAFSPDFCWGNDLGGSGWNGEYKNNVHNSLLLKPLDCSGWDAVYLQFYRWLNVMNGDKVYISVNNQVIWQNYKQAIRETNWSKQLFDISSAAANKDSIVIRFGLQTNGSETAGGWNIDDIMVDNTIQVAVNSEYKSSVPNDYLLFQNYPNPFNNSTSIQYQLKMVGLVKLVVYDILGKEMIRLVDLKQKSGNYTIVWNGKDKYKRDVSSGIYFVRFEVTNEKKEFNHNQIRKIMLVK